MWAGGQAAWSPEGAPGGQEPLPCSGELRRRRAHLNLHLQRCKQVRVSAAGTLGGEAAPRGGGLLPRMSEVGVGPLCLARSLLRGGLGGMPCCVQEGAELRCLLRGTPCNSRW